MWAQQRGHDLLKDTNMIRNICILAHVDHGKTTLADSLVASNGLISNRMAGTMRYMDDRPDEQARGITMKSSTVSLVHRGDSGTTHVINLIDSPGHVDFSSEVATAVRLSDGAVVLVDVVEGVSAQTHAVLRHAFEERLCPVLVLNKIDRLVLELQLSPSEAYARLQRVLVDVNVISATLVSGEEMAAANRRYDEERSTEEDSSGNAYHTDGAETASVFDDVEGYENQSAAQLYFDPAKGNVVFASASDGLGFGLGHFAKALSVKFQCAAQPLERVLWGDFFATKEKGRLRIKRGASARGKLPLFVTTVLTTIWEFYKTLSVEPRRRNKEKVDKIVKTLGLKLSARDTQSTDVKAALRSLVGQWLPLSRAVLSMVCRHIPSPCQLSGERISRLLFGGDKASTYSTATKGLSDTFGKSDPTGVRNSPLVAFVSKLVAVNTTGLADIQKNSVGMATSVEEKRLKRAELLARRRAEGKDRPPAAIDADSVAQVPRILDDEHTDDGSFALTLPAEEFTPLSLPDKQIPTSMMPETIESKTIASEKQKDTPGCDKGYSLIAHTRIFSGTLRVGQELHVLGPKYDPRSPEDCYATTVTVGRLFALMGPSLVPLSEAPAGAVVGIEGLEGHVLKSATLSSTRACPALGSMHSEARPIVRVVLEATNIRDMPALKNGMKLLHQADPGVEVLIQGTGEHVLIAAGEVHIERCLLDLRERFCPGIEFTCSAPLVPLRETLVMPPTIDMANEVIDEANTYRFARSHYLLDNTAGASLTSGRLDSGSAVQEPLAFGSVTSATTSNGHWTIRVAAAPLPQKAVEMMEGYRYARNVSDEYEMPTTGDPTVDESGTSTDTTDFSSAFLAELTTICLANNSTQLGCETARIISLAPKGTGASNILFDCIAEPRDCKACLHERLMNSICIGFQVVTQSGPLAEEPMMGVGFKVLEITTDDSVGSTSDAGFSGMVISATREACRGAFLAQHVRLMTAMYKCDLLVNATALGKVYTVLNKRNGKILSEEMKDGTDSFEIKSIIPVTDSFGFAEEMRRKSSGLANPQLIFSHWAVIHDDPFWVPSTDNELDYFGAMGDAPNPARTLLDDVRKRKGLYVPGKNVAGEVQRKNR